MKISVHRLHRLLLTSLSGLLLAAPAHILWLKSEIADGQPRAVLVFGESAADEAYHLPEPLAGSEIWLRGADGKSIQLTTERVDNDERIGLVAPIPDAKSPEVLEVVREYGIYAGMQLTYYAKHVRTDSNDQLAAVGPSSELDLDIVPKAIPSPLPEGRGGLIEIKVLWNGRPRADVAVSVDLDGANEDSEPQTFRTDAAGKITVRPEKSGLVTVLANVNDNSQSGELDGHKYTSAANYATLTFSWHGPGAKAAAVEPQPEDAIRSLGLPPLPEAVSSFGAAVCDGYLYVYSGHTGTEHDHSAANLSQHFRRVQLDGAGEASGTLAWEELPMETPLQGFALVAHGGKLYRVGGMTPRNATTDDKEDLRSTTEFAEFDPATKQWTALAPLPRPRSSHNAVVIGDKLYVIGGWSLHGPRKGDWLDDALIYDFSTPGHGWQPVPQGFRRRALAVSQWQGKVAAVGGMNEKVKVTRQVNFLDPAIGKWTKGPDLPGSGMSGFGVSAWNLDNGLYVCGSNGRVYRLADNGMKWDKVAKLARARFFHQLVPAAAPGALLVVGGASLDGHLDDIELIDVGSSAGEEPVGASPPRAAQSPSHADGKAEI